MNWFIDNNLCMQNNCVKGLLQSNSQQTEKVPRKCEEFALGYIFDQKKRFEYIHNCVNFTILS